MGKRGPKPKPRTILKLRGTLREDRHAGPDIEPSEPSPPDEMLPESRVFWDRVVPHLAKRGLMTELDTAALARYCDSLVDYYSARQKVLAAGFTTFTDKGNEIQHPLVGVMNKANERALKFEQQYGLTPSARTGLGLVGNEQSGEQENIAKSVIGF